MRRVGILMLCFVLLFTSVRGAYADWFDNWFNQFISSGPGYYKTQERGYLTFGSFSARTGLGTPTRLFSIELPRLNVGCGGIDAFLGGFSFAGFDYLVQKLQNLIQMAPVVAFKIALNTLSSTLGTELNWVEHIINMLNMLQFDECQLIKPLLSIDLTNPDTITQVQNYYASMFKKMSEGITSLFYRSRKDTESNPPTPSEIQERITTDCPDVVRNVYNKGSFVRYVLENYGIYDSTLEGALRAITGDIIVRNGNFEYIKPKALKIDPSSSEFKVSIVDRDGRETERDLDFQNRIRNVLLNAYSSKVSKSGVSSEYKALLNAVPFQLDTVINIAALTRSPELVDSVTPVTARGVFYALLIKLGSAANEVATTVGNTPQCDQNKCPEACSFSQWISEIQENVYKFRDIVYKGYLNALLETNTSLDFAFKAYTYYMEALKILTSPSGVNPAALRRLGLL